MLGSWHSPSTPLQPQMSKLASQSATFVIRNGCTNPINPSPTRNGANMSLAMSAFRTLSSQLNRAKMGLMASSWSIFCVSQVIQLKYHWNKTRTKKKKKPLFSMSSWKNFPSLSHILIYLVHFGHQTTGSLAIFPEQRVFCLWPMNCETLVSTACRLLRKVHPFYTRWTNCSLQLASWESIPARWSKVWKHGVPSVETCWWNRVILLNCIFFGAIFEVI